MSSPTQLKDFVSYVSQLKGDEKGEAQLFCDRFFRAFGHGGIIEAAGKLEARIKFSSGRTKFADCLWSPIGRDGVLIEMKKKSVKHLESHFPQARDYWVEMNPEKDIGAGTQKPHYIILCNFDRFLIYRQLSLVDEVKLSELEERASAFNFMLPDAKEPIFNHNVEAISKDAAKTFGELFQYLIHDKKEDRVAAQRFLLQCVLSLFSEDFGLLPNFFFAELIRDCQRGASTYDLFGGLFRQMADSKPAKGGRFKDVRYFNGGLFDKVEPLELDAHALGLLAKSAEFNWKNVNPAIFGSLFEGTLNAKERHAFGAHFTSEADIQKIVNPSIVRPWKERIANATTLNDLKQIRDDLGNFKVLDPSCGCGNFLFVAYRALKELEMQLIEKIAANFTARSTKSLRLGISCVTTKQFLGIDILPIAVEVAKTTMMVAKELAADEWNKRISPLMGTLSLSIDEGLPLDRLDDCIVCGDALLDKWPKFDVVVGNPPYQSKNKMQQEMDKTYIDTVRAKYPDVPGRADYCVYWFYRAHKEMKEGQRAGLVGTNTIRQNYSREGGLDYIIANGGTITEAVSTQGWSGDAAVNVSIVNWLKGEDSSEKTLIFQQGDDSQSPYEYHQVAKINSALSLNIDLTNAKALAVNINSEKCYQGQTHGHDGFLLSKQEFNELPVKVDIYPYLIGEQLLSTKDKLPTRYIIDLNNANDIFSAMKSTVAYELLKARVYPEMKDKALAEKEKTKKESGPRQNHFKKWWKFWRSRQEMINNINSLSRYVACSRVTKRPIFEFISPTIHPNDALMVFSMDDDYSFGVLQSSIHWEWFVARCSTHNGRPRYTSDTVFDSFPWPQTPKIEEVEAVAKAAVELRKIRNETMQKNGFSLRDLYRIMEETPENPVSKAQEKLDKAVCTAYKMKKTDDILSFLLELNLKLFDLEEDGKLIQGPGLPKVVTDKSKFVTDDCVAMPKAD